MDRETFKVIEGGLQTTVQDLGRPGYLAIGMPNAGAQDSFSLRMGNLLVGNRAAKPLLVGGEPGEAGLEILLLGPTLEVLRSTVVAITGADLSCKLNGKIFPMWTAIRVSTGSTISFGRPIAGARAYLCVAGGIEVPLFLGSKATYVRGAVGGIKGRALTKGDTLKTGIPKLSLKEIEGRTLLPRLIPQYTNEWEIRVVLGPQDHLFAEEAIRVFLTYEWQFSSTSDRMGFRFIGPKLSFKPRQDYLVEQAGSDPSNIVDDAIPMGGIQVPGGIEPIVLGVEGPSMGGYAKIATVISSDMSRLGQMNAGDTVRFRAVSVDEAANILRESEKILGENSITKKTEINR
jgi:antagonist of KipI